MATIDQSLSERLDKDLGLLASKKQEWAQLSYAAKVALLKDIRWRLLDRGTMQAKVAAEIMGEENNPTVVTGELLAGLLVPCLYLTKLIQTFEALARTGAPPKLQQRTLPNGQAALQVWPVTGGDKRLILLPGAVAEVYVRPGMPATQGGVYAVPEAERGGAVCAVLGAGNHGFLALKDSLYVLFERNEVVALKPHPIQNKWCEVMDWVLEPLTQRGYYVNVGSYVEGPAQTAALLHHCLVDCCHMTGGTATHDAIVWGAGPEEQARRKAANDPLLKKPMTSELGCVTPWIVTPGQWTDAELETHAKNVAVGFVSNNSCNCNATKVLLLPAEWPQADEFLDRVRAVLMKCPRPPAYYPGVRDRYAAWKARYPGAEELCPGAAPCSRPEQLGEPLPYLLHVAQEPPREPGSEYCLQVEPFAPVMSVIKLPGTGAEYLRTATDWANDKIWGTLSCTVLLHPEFEKAHPAEVQQALIDLRFGSVCVNAWAGIGYALPSGTWGAFGGEQTLRDVGSGLGCISNSLLIDHVQKTVLRVPFTGLAVPQPLHLQKPALGPGAAKAIMGYLAGGLAGMAKALLFMR